MFLTEIAGVSIPELARRFGTPCYVYDRAMIERRIDDLKGFKVIRYAQKACSNIAILALMRTKGVVVDAVSAGEIHRALTAGYKPADIVYTADVFERTALEAVARTGVRVNCGSTDMLEQYASVCPGRDVTVRLNPGFGHGHSRKTNTGGPSSKHGVWHEQLPEAVRRAKAAGIRITGIHMHIGSGTDFEHLSQVCDALTAAALTLGSDLDRVSAGGGLPTPYRPGDKPIDVAAFTTMWAETGRKIEERVGRPVELEVEPGRYLVAEAGYLVAEIRALKQQGNNRFLLLDAGFHNLARPILYGAYHPMFLCPADGRPAQRGTEPVVVGGPLCESGDIFTQADGGVVETRELPAAKVGDFLTLGVAGAYGYAMSSNYNSFPMLPEVLISGGQAELIRRKQTVEELTALESIPGDLK
jgi:diaminopimelate decarboxylase